MGFKEHELVVVGRQILHSDGEPKVIDLVHHAAGYIGISRLAPDVEPAKRFLKVKRPTRSRDRNKVIFQGRKYTVTHLD